ncbi:hypothetical protein [Paenibacillus popilliae]|uniref:Uncharacterized protein n=1 Tax=Paenibacillus popilliae ATCC 14706 TaxID=1212764 RepID=M9M4H9_PAEPP|nr:hypothetical protein [Paenibacillus popilliae]GAC43999.1 hypothetical protein PPOP_3399 [Paenibacillus popilliae ATCC 14706]
MDRDKFDLVTFIYTGKSLNKNTRTAIKILEELTQTVLGREEKEIEDFAENMSKEISIK